MRATHALGMGVKNYRNEKLGTIADLTFDLDSARLLYISVASRGWSPKAGAMKAVPSGAMLVHTDGKNLILDVQKSRWNEAPAVPRMTHHVIGAAALENIYRHYGLAAHEENSPPRAPGSDPFVPANAPLLTGRPASRIETQSEQFPPLTEIPPENPRADSVRGVRLRDMIGAEIRNVKRERLGSIHDLVIDLVNGKIVCSVISVKAATGFKTKLVAIPAGALSEMGERKFLLKADKNRLQRTPGFQESAWPALVNLSWGADIDLDLERESKARDSRSAVQDKGSSAK